MAISQSPLWFQSFDFSPITTVMLMLDDAGTEDGRFRPRCLDITAVALNLSLTSRLGQSVFGRTALITRYSSDGHTLCAGHYPAHLSAWEFLGPAILFSSFHPFNTHLLVPTGNLGSSLLHPPSRVLLI